MADSDLLGKFFKVKPEYPQHGGKRGRVVQFFDITSPPRIMLETELTKHMIVVGLQNCEEDVNGEQRAAVIKHCEEQVKIILDNGLTPDRYSKQKSNVEQIKELREDRDKTLAAIE